MMGGDGREQKVQHQTFPLTCCFFLFSFLLFLGFFFLVMAFSRFCFLMSPVFLVAAFFFVYTTDTRVSSGVKYKISNSFFLIYI